MQSDIQISQIRSASREIVRQVGLLRNRFQSIGSASQCHALVELDTHGEMNIGQLSQLLSLDQSTTSRLAAQMIRDGMCHRQLDEKDQRNKLLSLTKKGTALARSIHSEAKIQVQEALDLLSEEEKDTVVRGLSLYAKALKCASHLKECKIRKLLLKDVPQLTALTKSVWAEFGFDSNHPDAPFFEAELGKTYEIYSTRKSSYFVLVQDKKVVGGVGFIPLAGGEEDICELKGMYFSPAIRGLGLGSILLRYALQEAKREGYKKCYLETMDYMHSANSLYTKTGFMKLDKPRGNTKHSWTNCWYIKEI